MVLKIFFLTGEEMKICEDENILIIEIKKEEIFNTLIKLLNYMRVNGLNFEEIKKEGRSCQKETAY